MIAFQLKLTKRQLESLEKAQVNAEKAGDCQKIKRILSILLFSRNEKILDIAKLLKVSHEAVRNWIKHYLLKGLLGLRSGKIPGRPSKLTKSQRKELSKIIKAGPEKAGFPGACWRTPMIQHLIQKLYGVFYNAHYLSSLLKNMEFSYQKAKFVASGRDKAARKEWLEETWPEIMKRAKTDNSYVLFGDEASFPQWGSLSYTWAPIGKQPIVETSGKRKSYKVFGLIDYFTGKFFSKGHQGKLNGGSYIAFLKEVLSKTRKSIILIQDGAPYHKSKAVKDFITSEDRLTVYTLPSYSPDYNPIEKLWKKIKEKGVHMKYFPTFEELTNTVEIMLNVFDNTSKEVLSLFGFYQKLIN